jgi:hypothetical protein
MFETDDLILRKNEKNFILCLLEIARYGSKYGIQVPTIIKLEQEIDNEIKKAAAAAATVSSEVKLLSLSSSYEEEEEDDDSLDNNEVKSSSISISSSSSLTSSTSSLSINKNKSLKDDELLSLPLPTTESPPTSSPDVKIKKIIKKNLNNEFFKNMPSKQQTNLKKEKSESKTDIESELERHVNKLVNRCTCEKKFPVIQIGEGKTYWQH